MARVLLSSRSTAPNRARKPAKPVRRPRIDLASGTQAAPRHSGLFGEGRLTIQTKLEVGEPDDRFEHEADRVAEKVMRMPASAVAGAAGSSPGVPPAIQRLCAECAHQEEEEIQRQCAECEAEEETVQRQEDEEEEMIQSKRAAGRRAPAVTPGVASDLARLRRGGGRPLEASTRAFFEPRFGRDFSAVRVHDDDAAGVLSSRLNARAFTVGSDVFFGKGEYRPQTSGGLRLLAHELTHTVQQSGASSTSTVQRLVRESKVNCPGHDWNDVAVANSRARRFVDRAITRVRTARGRRSHTRDPIVQQVRLALWRAFRLNPGRPRTWDHWVPLILRRLGGVMGHMDSVVYQIECLSIGEEGRMPCGTCDPDPSNHAFTCDGSPSTIALCPQFWASTDIDLRAITLAHEVFHLAYAMIGDWFRVAWEPSGIPGISLPVTSPQPDITNAFCYAQFVALVNGFNVPTDMRCH